MKKNLHGNRFSAVAADGAVDWDHPLNTGRWGWWMAPSGIFLGRGRQLDLCGLHHGTPTNAPTPGPGRFGNTVFTNSATGYVEIGNPTPFLPLTAMSVYHWTYTSSTSAGSGFQHIAQCDSNWYLARGSGSFAFGSVWTAGGAIAPQFNITNAYDRWVFLGLTFDGTTVKLYQDGVFNTSGTGTPGTIAQNAVGFELMGTTGTNNFTGKLDDCSVYLNRCLSDADMWNLYLLGSAGYQTPDSPLRWFSTRSYAPGGTTTPVSWFPLTTDPVQSSNQQLVCY